MDGKCRSCQAEIIWIEDPQSNKKLPINAKPILAFQLEGKFVVRRMVHQSHFVTCPDREKWRKKKAVISGQSSN